MNRANPKVDGYIRKSEQWQAELVKLRAIVLESPLVEEVKWRVPCYTFENANVVIMGRFKACVMFNFVKGALLKDADGVLVKPGENSQSSRVIRFTGVEQVARMEPILKAYIAEAIDVEKAGLQVAFKKVTERSVPEEFQRRLDEISALKKAFDALTPGRRRAYLLHFSSAKQSNTRESRVAKCMQRILDGKGIDE